MFGTVYVGVHNRQAIQIICQDVGPDHAESLKLGNAAALSFRLKPTQ
jgi:hypothetical protein